LAPLALRLHPAFGNQQRDAQGAGGDVTDALPPSLASTLWNRQHQMLIVGGFAEVVAYVIGDLLQNVRG
jgi:hypothetical protein